MALVFVDLEKSFDTAPRKMAMATLRWMGESEVKMVEAMYENTTGRVVVGSSMANEFQVNIHVIDSVAYRRFVMCNVSNSHVRSSCAMDVCHVCICLRNVVTV